MIWDILQYPEHTQLLATSEAIETPMSPDMRKLAGDLLDTLRKHRGAGLAAPQVGRHVRMIAINPRMGCPFTIMVNPKIEFFSGQRVLGEEGCLSIEGGKKQVKVSRAEAIVVSFTDRADNAHKIQLKGMAARVVQHEIDHLDGKLIVQ